MTKRGDQTLPGQTSAIYVDSATEVITSSIKKLTVSPTKPATKRSHDAGPTPFSPSKKRTKGDGPPRPGASMQQLTFAPASLVRTSSQNEKSKRDKEAQADKSSSQRKRVGHIAVHPVAITSLKGRSPEITGHRERSRRRTVASS